MTDIQTLVRRAANARTDVYGRFVALCGGDEEAAAVKLLRYGWPAAQLALELAGGAKARGDKADRARLALERERDTLLERLDVRAKDIGRIEEQRVRLAEQVDLLLKQEAGLRADRDALADANDVLRSKLDEARVQLAAAEDWRKVEDAPQGEDKAAE